MLTQFMPVDPNVPWDLVAIVRRSRTKTRIIEMLDESPASATEVSDRIGIQTGSVSNVFRELKNTDPPLIECITPNQPHHRLYALTETGETIREHI